MATATKRRKRTQAHRTRWMIRRDLREVVAVENGTADSRAVDPWSEADFLRHLRQRNCIGMVSERGDEITGFVVYQLHRTHLSLLRFAAAPGTDAGAELYAKLLYKLTNYQRDYITAPGANGEVTILAGRSLPDIRPEWLTYDVKALCADGEPYTPILADALQDAGCDDACLLEALRDTSFGPVAYAALAGRFRGD
jgi:hypothetical protein